MNNLTNLVVRACKSKNPEKRLITLHNRYWGKNTPGLTRSRLIPMLAGICDTYRLVTLKDYLTHFAQSVHMANDYDGFKKGYHGYVDHTLHTLITTIRLADVVKFKGYRVPRKFRT